MNYTQINFVKVFMTYTWKQTLIDLGIALLTVFTFPFIVFCLIIRPIIFRALQDRIKPPTEGGVEK